MSSGWFVFAVVACIVISCGFVLALVLLKSAWAQKEREALSGEDLRVLEESAVLLIEDLKSETDQRLAALQDCMKRIECLTQEADLKISMLKELANTRAEMSRYSLPMRAGRNRSERESVGANIQEIAARASQGVRPADIARDSGLDCASVHLMIRLAKLQAN